MATPAVGTFGRRDRIFYTGMAVFAAVVVFAGFARTYFLKGMFGTPELPALLHLHGFIFTSWIVLLITQVSLVAAKRTDLHRKLGVAGGVLAALMVIVGFATAIHAGRLGHAPPGAPPPLVFMTIPFFDIIVFAILVSAGLYFRKRSDIHKRLMLIATIGILPAAIARIPIDIIAKSGPLAFFGLADLTILACAAYDTYVNRRLNPAYLWGGLVVIVSHPLRLFIGGSSAWLVFAQWLTR